MKTNCAGLRAFVAIVGTLRSTTSTSMKMSLENITFQYRKCFAIILLVHAVQWGRSILKIYWYERFQNKIRE